MAADDQPWDLAQTDAPPPPPPSAAPAAGAAPIDYSAIVQRLMQQPTLPQPDTTPVTRGLLSRLGEALGGGQTTGVMSPAQSETAGLRALRDFGTSLIAGSGYHPGQPALGAFATGFQGAEQSVRGSEQQAAATLAAQQQYAAGQQQQYLARLKEALPLLQMQRAGSVPNVLASGPAVPGTAQGAGTPGGSGVAGPLTAYGKGGPAANVPVPDEYMPLFQAASKRTGVPVDLLIAQARQESGFNPGATGGAGEVGIMQIHPKTATDPGFGLTGVRNPDILRDPATNINFGADYLAARAKAAGADLSTPQGQAAGLQAYNGGGDPNYVANVTRYMPPVAPYKVATTGAVPGPPSGSTTAPAATPPPPPGQTPPPASTAPAATQPDTRPDDALTWEEFQARHGTPISAASRPDLVVPVDPQSATELQSSMAQAKHDVDYALTPADKTKAQAQYTDASSKLASLRQDAAAKTAANVLAAQKQQGELLSPLYQKAKELAQAPILKKQEGDQAIELANVNSGNKVNADFQTELNTDMKNMGARVDDLQLLRGLSDNVGTPTPLTSIKFGGRSLADIISATGFGGQDLQNKAAAVQAFRAGVLNVVRDLRSGGAAAGEPRSNQDLQFVMDMAPSEWEDPNTRSAIISYLQQVGQRRYDLDAEATRQMTTTLPNGRSMPGGLAYEAARAKLPNMVPQLPPEGLGPNPAQLAVRQKFFAGVKPYTFFRYPNGSMDLYKGAPQQGQR